MNVHDATADDMRKALQLMMDYDNGKIDRRDVESSPYFGIIHDVVDMSAMMSVMLGLPSSDDAGDYLRREIESEYRRVFPLG